MTHFSTDRSVRLLLINPALPESFWSFHWWIDMLPGKRAINLPLELATLAGLCPSHWHVTIVDENVQSLPLEPEADLVGVCGMGAQFERQREILFSFSTQVSLNLADDAELLELFRTAYFEFVFVGIESPDELSIKETGKTQNLRGDMLTAVRTIYSHGIDVLAGFIVGFDNDTPKTFERQYRFITDSGIQVAHGGAAHRPAAHAPVRAPAAGRAPVAPGGTGRQHQAGSVCSHPDCRLARDLAAGDHRLDRWACHARLRAAPFRRRPDPGGAPGKQDRGLAALALRDYIA
jgi:hypothetical protein